MGQPDDEPEVSIKSLDARHMLRMMLYDLRVDHPECYAKFLGITPVSDEAFEMEMRDSDVRREVIKALEPFLQTHAQLLTPAMLAVHFDLPHKEGSDEEVLAEAKSITEMYAEVYHSLIRAATLTAISTLIDQGVLMYTSEDGSPVETYRTEPDVQ